MITFLCGPGTQWKVSKGIPVSFKANALNKFFKVWYHFLTARLLPVKHVSVITKDRAVLLYAMVTGKTINVGKLIFENILHVAGSAKEGIWYLSLITALCKQARVQWSSVEELLHPKVPLDANIVNRLYNYQPPGGNSSSAPRPPPRATSLTIPQRLERLEHRAAYHTKCMQAMEQMMQACASHMGINMHTFPSLPPDPMTNEEEEESDLF